MTTRLSTRKMLYFHTTALILLASVSGAAAQEYGTPAFGQPAASPPWMTQAASPPAAPQMLPDEPIQNASILAAATDDPNWINAPVQAASHTMRSFNGNLAGENGFKLGSISVVPYGILWGDMIYSTSRTFPGHFILWIESEETQGESTFVADARRSRVGADIKGPEVDIFGGMTGGGKVEVDFFGGFTIENTTDVRLRHVYWEAKNQDMRMLIGQTWDVASPLLPNTVNFSVNWGAGNIGFRRTQFRLERYLHLSDDLTLTLQGALAQNIVPDLASGGLANGVIRETGKWPMLQLRSAVSFIGMCQQPWTLGVSGSIGETGFDFLQPSPGPLNLPPEDDARFREWSVNGDFKMPLTDRLGFQGEIFTGANLSNMLGGIGQGVCPCSRVPIRTTGGWAEIAYEWNPCVTTHVGFGIDDPDDDDSYIGRTYNRVLYGNVFVQLTDNLRTGFEVSGWRTTYHNTTLNEPNPDDRIAFPILPGEATVFDWTVQYRF